jgi:hypothetical protein
MVKIKGIKNVRKVTLRWDYKRKLWRSRWYWLKKCQCGQEDLMVARNWICRDCNRIRYAKLSLIRTPALAAVAKAVKEGRLPKLDGSIPCADCGNPARAYDHREYAKPLDVTPVCRPCNVKRGPAKETAGIVIANWLYDGRFDGPAAS